MGDRGGTGGRGGCGPQAERGCVTPAGADRTVRQADEGVKVPQGRAGHSWAAPAGRPRTSRRRQDVETYRAEGADDGVGEPRLRRRSRRGSRGPRAAGPGRTRPGITCAARETQPTPVPLAGREQPAPPAPGPGEPAPRAATRRTPTSPTCRKPRRHQPARATTQKDTSRHDAPGLTGPAPHAVRPAGTAAPAPVPEASVGLGNVGCEASGGRLTADAVARGPRRAPSATACGPPLHSRG